MYPLGVSEGRCMHWRGLAVNIGKKKSRRQTSAFCGPWGDHEAVELVAKGEYVALYCA